MAVRTLKFCDRHPDSFFDDEEEVETVYFGLRGRLYEMEMCRECQAEFDEAMALWIDEARPVKAKGRPKGDPESNGSDNGLSSAGKIRAWARENGWDIASTGGLPYDVIDAYNAAHRGAEEQPGDDEIEPEPAPVEVKAAPFGECKWCGKTDFKSDFARGPHEARCKKNPDRIVTGYMANRETATNDDKVKGLGTVNGGGKRTYSDEEKAAVVLLARKIGPHRAAQQMGLPSHGMVSRWRIDADKKLATATNELASL